ncbi:MAG: sarcosine oxidase subunit alpha family protein [Pseudomonadota bacterium]
MKRFPDPGSASIGHSIIDRKARIDFTFDGRAFSGYQGDTLASALMANGVKLVGRSFKYHRPRGIMTHGSHEPNALVGIGEGDRHTPNLSATMVELYDGLVATSQNCFPSLNHDFGAVSGWFADLLPAGFYYKTFMWPSSSWLFYERFIRKAAGLGRAPTAPDPDQYSQRYAHCDVLIAGGGIAGLSAARAAASQGLRVILADENAKAGGFAASEPLMIEGQGITAWIETVMAELRSCPNVTILLRTTIAGYFDDHFLTALERVRDHLAPDQASHLPRQRFWKIRAAQVILAQGACERPMIFGKNDLPGIMLAGSVVFYAARYQIRPGRAVLVYTNNDSGWQNAISLHQCGIQVTILDPRDGRSDGPSAELFELAKAHDIPVWNGYRLVTAKGRKAVKGAIIAPVQQSSHDAHHIGLACDLIAMSGGWTPSVHLFSQAGGKLRFDTGLQAFLPDSARQKPFIAGAGNGSFVPHDAINEGEQAGFEAAARIAADHTSPRPARKVKSSLFEKLEPLQSWFGCQSQMLGHSEAGKWQFMDFQNDVKLSDVHLAWREGYRSIEHLKRYTTTGMGTDQGKTSNLNALETLADLSGKPIDAIGTTTFRPPYTPLTFGAVAGLAVGSRFVQARTTPMHDLHKGAVFEDVGDWKRPRYFPIAHETMDQAVRRECLAVRTEAGLLDASTLGKIDIEGPDAATFLDLIYTNLFSSLAVGRCRYGLMLNEHGMVFDDGVTTRLGEDHFHMTTTTGGAARVLNWCEEWLQTEWPELRVWCTSVSEQWAVATLTGPNARAILGQICDLDLADANFRHMSMQTGLVAGVKARIFRVSFTGELAFEINVPARFGHHLWQVLLDCGRDFGLCCYGTEAMHVLRAEKGFIIVGQDSDGTMTPDDLGLGWMVSGRKADFLGKRSLSRSDTMRSDRKQLVGLLCEDEALVLPEGVHLVERADGKPPMKPPMAMMGHVTSSYHSPTLGRSFALGVVKAGRARLGETFYAAMMDGTRPPVKLVSPVFYDPENIRLV